VSPQRRAWRFGKAALPLCAAALTLSACAPKQPTTQPAEEVSQSVPGEFDSGALSNVVAELEQAAQRLPGRTPEAHRSAMSEAFVSIAAVLPYFEGAEPSWAFEREVQSLKAAQAKLAANEQVEPAIDSGLRTAYSALQRLARNEELSDPSLPPMLEKLRTSVDAYGETLSIGRPYVAADAVQAIARISRQMADHLAPPPPPEEEVPATAPLAESPATTPAEPVETPTTEPAAPSETPAIEPAPIETPVAEPAAPAAPKESPAPAVEEPAPTSEEVNK
jgi:hypothetical protein